MSGPEWTPTGWWRAVLPDGTVWCESSNEAEVRRIARAAPTGQPATVQRHMRRVEERWKNAPPTPKNRSGQRCPVHGYPWVVPDAPDGYRRCMFYIPELGASEDYGCPQPPRSRPASTDRA